MKLANDNYQHFLDIDGLEQATLRKILDKSRELKASDLNSIKPLTGKTIALIFEKPSTRTRVSFEVAIYQLGGNSVTLNKGDIQLGRGETIADTARVLSRYVDMIVIRCFKHETLTEAAKHSSVPIINGLSDHSHPCQIMADIMTFEEKLGNIQDKIVAWLGDCNNVCNTWLVASVKFGFHMRIACPAMFHPSPQVTEWVRQNNWRYEIMVSPQKAVKDSDCVVTDTWVSMGQEEMETWERVKILSPYQVNDKMMAHAKKEAIFLHCLPAHRGQEVSDAVIDGPQSVVWDEAENRLHTQKAIMMWCLGMF